MARDFTLEKYSNSLDNVQAMDQRECNVHIMGGSLNHNNRFIYGYETMEQISKINYDVAFIGIDSLMEDDIPNSRSTVDASFGSVYEKSKQNQNNGNKLEIIALFK